MFQGGCERMFFPFFFSIRYNLLQKNRDGQHPRHCHFKCMHASKSSIQRGGVQYQRNTDTILRVSWDTMVVS